MQVPDRPLVPPQIPRPQVRSDLRRGERSSRWRRRLQTLVSGSAALIPAVASRGRTPSRRDEPGLGMPAHTPVIAVGRQEPVLGPNWKRHRPTSEILLGSAHGVSDAEAVDR